MLDRRSEQRLPAFLRGMISYNRKLWRTDCVVRNTSTGGIKITGRDLSLVPEQFDLSIPQKNADFRVRLKWRGNGEIGVAIETTNAPEISPLDAERNRRLKRLENETNTLRRLISLHD